MKAVVLVGGEGTRLRPLTLTTPKQMLPVGRRPMIERVIEWLAVHGVSEAVLSLGYRPDAFMKAYPDGRCAGVRLLYAVEGSPLDTAGAIRYAASEGCVEETFVVVNGDVLTDLDLGELVGFHRSRGAEATVALTPVEDPSRFGVVDTAGDGRVTAFVEKPALGEAPTNLINAGTYVLEPSVLSRIPAGRRVSVERETFPAVAAEGLLYAMASPAAWLDAGTPATYLAANLAYAEDGAERTGPSSVVSNSVVGADVVVGAGATVVGSVLMDGVELGDSVLVRDSVLGPAVRVGEGASVTDMSVLGEGVVVGEGVALRGARLGGVSGSGLPSEDGRAPR